jgi:hypothetical protein
MITTALNWTVPLVVTARNWISSRVDCFRQSLPRSSVILSSFIHCSSRSASRVALALTFLLLFKVDQSARIRFLHCLAFVPLSLSLSRSPSTRHFRTGHLSSSASFVSSTSHSLSIRFYCSSSVSRLAFIVLVRLFFRSPPHSPPPSTSHPSSTVRLSSPFNPILVCLPCPPTFDTVVATIANLNTKQIFMAFSTCPDQLLSRPLFTTIIFIVQQTNRVRRF